MKVNIVDKAALAQVRPDDLRTYLGRHGWRLGYTVGTRLAEVWRTSDDEAPHGGELLVPKSRAVTDYAERISRILTELERRLGRSQLDIWNDLVSVASDVITIRLESLDNVEGKISADLANSVVSGTMGLLAASACSAVDSRPYFRTRKPGEAMKWIAGLKMGLTRPGSYIFVFMMDAVDPRLQRRDILPSIELQSAPFERKVLGTTSLALDSVVRAAHDVSETGRYDGFLSRVNLGVSANLCDALVEIIDPALLQKVDFSFSWALNASEINVPSIISIAPEIKPTVERASELLKSEEPPSVDEVEGFVTRLVQGQQVVDRGEIAVDVLFEEGVRKVIIVLPKSEYQLAIDAHKRKRKVVCAGVVKITGSRYILENPHDFREVA